MVAPTGQYDPTKLVNNGSNRWAFKPKFGYSERWAIGYSMPMGRHGSSQRTPSTRRTMRSFLGRTQSDAPVGAFEGHLL